MIIVDFMMTDMKHNDDELNDTNYDTHEENHKTAHWTLNYK